MANEYLKQLHFHGKRFGFVEQNIYLCGVKPL